MSEIPPSEGDRDSSLIKKKDSPPRLDDLQPGDVIRFADITELATFEDIIADSVDPKHDPERWAARPALRDLIKPPTFNGTITNIELAVMANPYDRLLDANKRGWKGSRKLQLGRHHELASSVAAEFIPRYRGFILTAEPQSSRPGIRGQQIQAELWYFPTPPVIKRAGRETSSYNVDKSGEKHHYRYTTRKEYIAGGRHKSGEDIRRIVTQPRMEREVFLAHDAASRTVGFNQLRQAMMRPISTPMRD
jgi:hypothetical protein